MAHEQASTTCVRTLPPGPAQQLPVTLLIVLYVAGLQLQLDKTISLCSSRKPEAGMGWLSCCGSSYSCMHGRGCQHPALSPVFPVSLTYMWASRSVCICVGVGIPPAIPPISVGHYARYGGQQTRQPAQSQQQQQAMRPNRFCISQPQQGPGLQHQQQVRGRHQLSFQPSQATLQQQGESAQSLLHGWEQRVSV